MTKICFKEKKNLFPCFKNEKLFFVLKNNCQNEVNSHYFIFLKIKNNFFLLITWTYIFHVSFYWMILTFLVKN